MSSLSLFYKIRYLLIGIVIFVVSLFIFNSDFYRQRNSSVVTDPILVSLRGKITRSVYDTK